MREMSSLNQFFFDIECHFRCYNIGRRIYPVDLQTFIDFENTQNSWQAPFLQHAWLALVFWKDDKGQQPAPEHHVWFLKLPLDEQARLNLAARDDFLRHLFEVLGDYLTHSQKTEYNKPSDKLHFLESKLQNNPYGFQPKQEQMANFHAIVHKQLSRPASSFYASTQNYLSGSNDPGHASEKHVFKNWHELGLQGFADIAARLDESCCRQTKTNEQLINEAIPHLPREPLQVLCACLENHPISTQTIQVIYKQLLTELKKNAVTASTVQLCIALIRASAQASDQSLQVQLLSKILQSPMKSDIEVLATIAGRCWQIIPQREILLVFLESLALADVQHQGAFKAILSDLMFIPGMRDSILQAFRSPERSRLLTQAIGAFFKTI